MGGVELRGQDLLLLGLFLGCGLGVGLTLLVGRLRRWLGRSEEARLAAEVRTLKRRLQEKDRHISRMLAETERLAERLAQKKPLLKAADEASSGSG